MTITITKAPNTTNTYRVTDADGVRIGYIFKAGGNGIWVVRDLDGDIAHESNKADAFKVARAKLPAPTDAATCQLREMKARKEIFFKRKADAKGVFIINHYNRCDKTFTCENYETGAELFLKANTVVHIGFEY